MILKIGEMLGSVEERCCFDPLSLFNKLLKENSIKEITIYFKKEEEKKVILRLINFYNWEIRKQGKDFLKISRRG